MRQLRLDQLGAGEQAIVTAIEAVDGGSSVARRLQEIGLGEGVHVEVVHRAPLGGDPIAVKADDMLIAIRRAQAALILVEPVRDASAPGLTRFAEAAE